MEKTEDAKEEDYGEHGWPETQGSGGGGEGRGGSSEAAGMQPENIAGDTEKTENGEVEDYGERSWGGGVGWEGVMGVGVRSQTSQQAAREPH